MLWGMDNAFSACHGGSFAAGQPQFRSQQELKAMLITNQAEQGTVFAAVFSSISYNFQLEAGAHEAFVSVTLAFVRFELS